MGSAVDASSLTIDGFGVEPLRRVGRGPASGAAFFAADLAGADRRPAGFLPGLPAFFGWVNQNRAAPIAKTTTNVQPIRGNSLAIGSATLKTSFLTPESLSETRKYSAITATPKSTRGG